MARKALLVCISIFLVTACIPLTPTADGTATQNAPDQSATQTAATSITLSVPSETSALTGTPEPLPGGRYVSRIRFFTQGGQASPSVRGRRWEALRGQRTRESSIEDHKRISGSRTGQGREPGGLQHDPPLRQPVNR